MMPAHAVSAQGISGPTELKFGKAWGTETVITSKNIIIPTGSVTIFLVNYISIVKIQVTTITSLSQPGVTESSRRFNPFNISSTGNSGSSLPSRQFQNNEQHHSYFGPSNETSNMVSDPTIWSVSTGRSSSNGVNYRNDPVWMPHVNSGTQAQQGLAELPPWALFPIRGRHHQPLLGAGSVMEVPGDECQAFASDIEGRRRLVSEVYSWEPIICHDSLDMGCLGGGYLDTFFHNQVLLVKMYNYLVVKLIGQHVPDILAEEKTCRSNFRISFMSSCRHEFCCFKKVRVFTDLQIPNLINNLATPKQPPPPPKIPGQKDTEGISVNTEPVDVETQQGFVPVDERMRVIDSRGKLVPHLYCIGDANGKIMISAQEFQPQAREKAEKEEFEIIIYRSLQQKMVDAALIATGRARFTNGLGLENVNVEAFSGCKSSNIAVVFKQLRP
ncbi:hypothetical protein L2E82_01566 [Cichorium intybus]|uniref:Uncharacterized protein n=1 Tax=Cichorium intybus TaxID=13427 RepID=A0ACB9GZ77_CICIN|nr:hypothetical protein L2E82_01566 [Cichorium intybus]